MKLRRLFLILTSLVITFILVSCGSTDDSGAAPASSKEQTPIEVLTSDEKSVYDAVIKANFFNQKEARVLDCVISDNNTFVGIQGTNKMGGTISKCYMIKNGELSEVDDYDSNCNDEDWKLIAALVKYPSGKTSIGVIYDYAEKVEVKHFPDDSVGKINKAIKYYWEEKGLL